MFQVRKNDISRTTAITTPVPMMTYTDTWGVGTSLTALSSFTNSTHAPEYVILIRGGGGVFNVNLPKATTYTGTFWIKNRTVNTATLVADGSDSIDGGVKVIFANGSIIIRSDGIDDWVILDEA